MLAKNRLTGTLPPELGQMTGLFDLYVAKNQLRGSIPEAWCGQGLTLVHVRAQLEPLQDTFVSQFGSYGGQRSSSSAEMGTSVSPCVSACGARE